MTKRNAVKWIAPVGLSLALALLGACGGASESEDQTSATTTTTAEGDATAPTDSEAAGATETPADATVEITDFAFAPKEIRISVGDTVRWINRDEFLHTVTSGQVDGPENIADDKFDENLDEAGSEAVVTFDEAGTFTYFCKQHNAMDGVVIVE